MSKLLSGECTLLFQCIPKGEDNNYSPKSDSLFFSTDGCNPFYSTPDQLKSKVGTHWFLSCCIIHYLFSSPVKVDSNNDKFSIGNFHPSVCSTLLLINIVIQSYSLVTQSRKYCDILILHIFHSFKYSYDPRYSISSSSH